jgi:hypothetical protein
MHGPASSRYVAGRIPTRIKSILLGRRNTAKTIHARVRNTVQKEAKAGSGLSAIDRGKIETTEKTPRLSGFRDGRTETSPAGIARENHVMHPGHSSVSCSSASYSSTLAPTPVCKAVPCQELRGKRQSQSQLWPQSETKHGTSIIISTSGALF